MSSAVSPPDRTTTGSTAATPPPLATPLAGHRHRPRGQRRDKGLDRRAIVGEQKDRFAE